MIEPKTLTLGGFEYSVGRLDLFQALNVTRVVAPILPVLLHETLGKIASAIIASKEEGEASVEDKLVEIAQLVTLCEPVLNRIAKMPKDDFEGVVRTCLSAVERKVGDRWTKVIQGGAVMFDDIDQMTALTLTFTVIYREIHPTFAALKL